MEKNPQAEMMQHIDVLAKMNDRVEYLQTIANVEADAALMEDGETLPSEPLEVLDEMLGFDGAEETVIFSGVAFEVDDQDELTDEPRLMTDRTMVFGGANYYYVGDAPRVFFDLRDEFAEPNVSYAVTFESILRLHCERPDLSALFAHHASNCRGLVTDPNFLVADEADQEELLKSFAVSCYEELVPLIDVMNSSVECTEFYEHKDDESEKELIVEKVDQSDDEFEDRTAVTGIVMGVIYLEVAQGRLPFRDKEDFLYGGVPCLAVRNEAGGITSFVPIDRIEYIETND